MKPFCVSLLSETLAVSATKIAPPALGDDIEGLQAEVGRREAGVLKPAVAVKPEEVGAETTGAGSVSCCTPI